MKIFKKKILDYKNIFQYFAVLIAVFTLILTYINVRTTQNTLELTSASVDIAEENLTIFKEEIQKQRDPLFSYNYNRDIEAFEVQATNNINIIKINWLLPLKKEYHAINSQHKLTKKDIDEAVLLHFANKMISPMSDNVEDLYYLKCYLYNWISKIYLLINIEYRIKGNNQIITANNLVTINNINYSPYITIESQNPTDKFLTDAFNRNNNFLEMSEYTKELFNKESIEEIEMKRVLNGRGNCRIILKRGYY